MKSFMHFGLSENTIRQIRDSINSEYKVEKIMLYGSRAKGTFRPNADLDLTLIGKKMSLVELFAIETALDDLLLPYQIDLSLFHKIESVSLRKEIEDTGVDFGKTS